MAEKLVVLEGDALERFTDVLDEIRRRAPYRVTVWVDDLDCGVKFKLDENVWTSAVGYVVER